MPDYLAPGVFVEETPFRPKPIGGVDTTTAGFAGPCAFGPLDLTPVLITSLGDFERIYGRGEPLGFSDAGTTHNFLWHAVRAFFAEGGRRLYVSRVFRPSNSTATQPLAERWLADCATAVIPSSQTKPAVLRLRARFPGRAGNARVRLTLRLSENLLDACGRIGNSATLEAGDVVVVRKGRRDRGDFYLTSRRKGRGAWSFFKGSPQIPADPFTLTNLPVAGRPEVRRVSVSVAVEPNVNTQSSLTVSDLSLDPARPTKNKPRGLTGYFHASLADTDYGRTIPIVIEAAQNSLDGLQLLQALFAQSRTLKRALLSVASTDASRSVTISLTGGSDGRRPEAEDYAGSSTASGTATGLKQFESLDELSIVAAPGATFGCERSVAERQRAFAILHLLVSHCTQARHRFAVLDGGDNQTTTQIRQLRAAFDSSHAALYYPWIKIADPATGAEIALPPSGFVAGLYARSDRQRGVWKAPANEIVTLAIGFERLLNGTQQETLNAEGINCFRFFTGRGFRLWGARTTSSDPAWKYINVRRYFASLERSIERGTRWVAFEPNGEALWSQVRRVISDFLLNEWRAGALLGDKPEKAFFVKCDRTTMTQADIDRGRLVCLIGVAPLRPAEFVIFRIGQWTASHSP